MAKRNCIAASLVWRRLSRPAQESVDDRAQVKQLIEPAEIVGKVRIRRNFRRLLSVPISPSDRNERTGAVRQNHENETHAASANAGDYRKRVAFKWVPFARNHY